MVFRPSLSSGVLGFDGRAPVTDDLDQHSADLSLDGVRRPLVSPARVYICGITPYDVTHLGHASTFVWADVATAVMGMAGVAVSACRNVTDVDDVLTVAAGVRGEHYDEFALYQEFLFEQDMKALQVKVPQHVPRARHHITHVQQLAAALLARGHAYERGGQVYFRGRPAVVNTGMDLDQARALAAAYGDDPDDPLRDDPSDVPIWRASPAEHPAWPSPWGWGRPGWHAECAAMALAVHGSAVDLLVGGADLAFPHHAYQAAMVEAATGVTPFARARMHVGAVHQDGRKMAKSTGNLTLVADLLEHHSAAAVRLMLLNRRWRESWEYQLSELDRAAEIIAGLYRAAAQPDRGPAGGSAVRTALLDDLDVPTAVAIAAEEGGAAARILLSVLALN